MLYVLFARGGMMAKKRFSLDVDDWNKWLTLGANIGVVIGLIVLIVELRQNSNLMRASMEIDRASSQAHLELAVSNSRMAELLMKSVYTPEELTVEDVRILDGPLVTVMMQWDHLMIMREAGLVSRKRIERHIQNTAPFYFGSRFGKRWWNAQATGWEGTEMYDIADPIVQKLDEDFMARYYNGLLMPTENEPTAEEIE